jgi:hypothetical protein
MNAKDKACKKNQVYYLARDWILGVLIHDQQ